ncbi:MAG: glutamate-5-semialdehyde dehydrogenase [Planctomycetia bacterium]|nr:glutamate-5-semialdehyde dehydrogenase [Planctomycetia bacterium]
MNELQVYCEDLAKRAREASLAMASLTGSQKNGWLRTSAEKLRADVATPERSVVLAANTMDLRAARDYGLSTAAIDRLKLTAERVRGIATALDEIAMLPDPIGEIISSTVRPNGLQVNRTRVPLGVIFFIYESRPNVTADAAALCVKSGNAVILRGGKEAAHSSRAIVEILQRSATQWDIPADAIQLVSVTDRDAVGYLLEKPEYIDVAIPRGGEGLIRRVVAEAKMPVIKHFTGNCHVYLDATADEQMAIDIVINGKCQRPGVCNATESLVVHAACGRTVLPAVAAALRAEGVEIRGDRRTCEIVPEAVPATETDYATEFLGPVLSCVIVDSADEAIRHINRYSSKHTEAIVTRDYATSQEFVARIDSSAVMVNASTRFNDGGEFGLGAEIGISTDKLHARGPCGLHELTSYKYVVRGNGQIRG